jgi:hypothetical protein
MKSLLALIGVVFLSANLVTMHGGGGEPTVFSSPAACTMPGCYPLWLTGSEGMAVEQVIFGSGTDVSEARTAKGIPVVSWQGELPSAWAVDRPASGESSGASSFVFLQKTIVVSRRSNLPTESGLAFIAPQESWKTSGGQAAAGEVYYRLRSIE